MIVSEVSQRSKEFFSFVESVTLKKDLTLYDHHMKFVLLKKGSKSSKFDSCNFEFKNGRKKININQLLVEKNSDYFKLNMLVKDYKNLRLDKLKKRSYDDMVGKRVKCVPNYKHTFGCVFTKYSAYKYFMDGKIVSVESTEIDGKSVQFLKVKGGQTECVYHPSELFLMSNKK